MLADYQRDFIDLALGAGVLCFGQYQLKSGRISPYFFNAGLFCRGDHMNRLGYAYARTIQESGVAFDMLFGPAYKGIPLVVATAMALQQHFQRDCAWAFDRKEAKDHGEGGTVVGAPLAGRVLIIDDVVSSGLSVNQAAGLITAAGARVAGVCVALDRQERGQTELSARQEIERQQGMGFASIVSLEQLFEYVKGNAALSSHLQGLREYRDRYGV